MIHHTLPFLIEETSEPHSGVVKSASSLQHGECTKLSQKVKTQQLQKALNCALAISQEASIEGKLLSEIKLKIKCIRLSLNAVLEEEVFIYEKYILN